MNDSRVSLDAEQLSADGYLQAVESAEVPLAVAAAIAFHQAHRNTHAFVARRDYEDALNIAAAALSRLVPIHTLVDPKQGRSLVEVNLVEQRFLCGATELRGRDGSFVRDMTVRRTHLVSALSLIRRVGMPYAFIMVPAQEGAAGKAGN